MIDRNQDLHAPVTKGRIRMAYSFQGYQPVLCTVLCDQPLYYMEEEIFEEEADSLFLEEESLNAALGADLGSIQRKISIYDEVAKKFAQDDTARLSCFADNAASFGAPVGDIIHVDRLLSLLTQSRYGESLYRLAQEHGVTIQTSAQVRSAAYDAAAGVVLLNAHQTTGDALLMLTAALRRHAQCQSGAGGHPLHFHPDEAILVNRAQQADLVTAQVRAAWELQLAGIHEPWARLENSQAADLARAFAREALCDFRTLNNGRAAQAVFESWFLSDRCKIEDRELIQAMLVDQERRRFEDIQEELSPAFIAALGEQTLGKNYLAEMAGTLLSDPIFSEVRDRSNANFLWFVKFERSFNQTEQALQAEETIHSFESVQSAASPGQDRQENNGKTRAYNKTAAGFTALDAAGDLDAAPNSSNVVYVRFGRSLSPAP